MECSPKISVKVIGNQSHLTLKIEPVSLIFSSKNITISASVGTDFLPVDQSYIGANELISVL